MATATRSATLLARTVLVLCPHCGEEYENPDAAPGEEVTWTLQDVRQNSRSVTCNACDEEFRIELSRPHVSSDAVSADVG